MTISLESITRPTRDIIKASSSMSAREVRYMVDAYYQMQEYRKSSSNQCRSIDQEADEGQTHESLSWMLAQVSTMEKQIERAMDAFSEAHPVGPWLRNIYGIGPVIAAGMLAHIDITKAPTVGHIWRFAGLDPTLKWEKGKKRPWNAQLKVLCWKAGQSFMKFSNRPECFYGRMYRERKAYEIERNESGSNAELAATLMSKYAKSTEAYKHLATGVLPPAQIDARARRWAVKLFLSHMHRELYVAEYGTEPPLPYPIAHLNHAHIIESRQ